ncbi:ATP-binding protein [Rhodovulum euryhalinum]|uniref:histidine kinase n=1 Tax=Rhodovulum euryhalinum TaxID=35805 RepID=A0A4R2KHA5_9RHOB|nr:ATP-binding protein [Rhodovulum euryhalinum]TCO69378.1 two-component system osmolarity sensor histidine kinase EnvZ [Rhodovulum euryhalinum]
MSAPSLVRRHTLWMTGAFALFELLLAGLFVALVAMPMLLRAADDFAGLMVLAAQTWSELPPETRPALERELRESHGLVLAPAIDYDPVAEFHPPCILFLEAALARRSGDRVHLHREERDGEAWYWANLPAGAQELAFGFPQSRYNSEPETVIALGVVAGLVLALGLSAWIARRLTQPILRLERAMATFGSGGDAPLLPEDGPRELASLSRHFNGMVWQIRDLLAARTTLLAGVSHDLRSPLARMRLSLALMRGSAEAAHLDRLDRDVERMNVLIGDVLDLARGLGREPPQRLEIAALFEGVAADHAGPDHPVEITPVSGTVAAPPLALRRALGNLLQNALRYAPGPGIALVARREGGTVRLGVLDRGPGIPVDRLQVMTEPFQRLDDSRSPATGGAGLGLAIAKELARANGWVLDLQNRGGGGLEAWIGIPETREAGIPEPVSGRPD